MNLFFLFLVTTSESLHVLCRLNQSGIFLGGGNIRCWSLSRKYNSTTHTHAHTRNHIPNHSSNYNYRQSRNGTNNRVWGEKTRTNSLKDSCPETETGQSQPWIISYNKIFKNSLYRGLSSLIYTLIYGKETTKIYMYKFIYICHVYISINHFKSSCGKTIRSVTERETESGREERRIPVTPLLHCR